MSILDLHKTNYRAAFALLVVRLLAPPLLLAGLFARFAPQSVRPYASLAYILAVPVYWTIKIQYDSFNKRREAARLGAVLAPEVKGKWLGNVDLIFVLGKTIKNDYVATELERLFESVGGNFDTINLRVLWQDMLITRDHKIVQHVLATGFQEFEKGDSVKLKLYALFGDGIFNSDGQQWKEHRALTRPFFARERVTDFEHFDKHSSKVINIFQQRADAGESLDIQDVFGRFTLDAAGEFLFGVTDLNTLDQPLSHPGKARMGPKGSAVEGEIYGGFVNAFENLQVIIPPRAPRGALWPLWELHKEVATEANRAIDDFIGPLINRALDAKLHRGKGKSNADEGSLLDHMSDATDDNKVIRDELVNILLASRDTTAALLTFLFYILATNNDVLKKLRAEIIDIVPSGAPTFADIRKMKYLRACLDETLRLFPPVPNNWRQSTKPTVFQGSERNEDGTPKRIYMPGPGVPIRYSVLLMQRRKDLWSEDALQFVPERWIDPERVKALTSDPFKFLPFNAGPRICLGQNFAYNEASFVVVRILQAFDSFELRQKQDAPEGSCPPDAWKFETGGRRAVEEVWPQAALTLYSRGGMWIKMGHAAH